MTEEIYGCPYPFFEAHLRLPTKNASRLAAIKIGQVDITRTLWSFDNFGRVANNLFQCLVDLIDRSAFARANTENIVIAGVERYKVGTSYISHVHIIFLLFAVAIDANWLAVKKALGENGDHSCFSIGILARPIDIAIAQCRIGEAVGFLPVT